MIKKLGSVPFLNSKPLTYLFDKGDYSNYQTKYMFPSALLDSLISGETFLSLLSIVDHLSDSQTVSLDNYCISSVGRVDSVILVANCDIMNLERVFLDSRSKSANILYKVIQENFINKEIQYSSLTPDSTSSYPQNTGQVIIGDLALELTSQRPSGLKIYDLSEIWYKETLLPFTFATFNYYVEKPNSKVIDLLDESYSEGVDNVDGIIKDFLTNSNFRIERNLAETYLKERIVYKLSKKHIEGIELFRKLSEKFAKWKKRSFNNNL